ncbi:MAG: recombinase family protein [Clostridiaceae bacterium]
MKKITESSTITPETAVAYVRVSTRKQKIIGTSDNVQKKTAIEYVKRYNEDHPNSPISLDKNLILDEVKPASTIENGINDFAGILKTRPVLEHIMDMVFRKDFKHLIIYSRDRLTRDFNQFITLKYLLNKYGIQIHYSRPGESLNIEDNKINRFVDNILASVAEFEANVISIRVKAGGSQTVKNGNWPGGRAPYGYFLDSQKIRGRKNNICKLKRSYYEMQKVKEIFELYNQGYGYRKIAHLMNDKYEETIWTKSKVEKILHNEVYAGKIVWNRRGGRRHPNTKGDPIFSNSVDNDVKIIDTDLWENSEAMRIKKLTIKDPQYFITKYLFKGKVFCKKCGQKLITKNYGPSSVYKCTTKKDNKSELIVKHEYLDNILLKELDFSLLENNLETLWENYTEKKLKYIEVIKDHITINKKCLEHIDSIKKELSLIIAELNDSIENASYDEKEKDKSDDIITDKKVDYFILENLNNELLSLEKQRKHTVLKLEELTTSLNRQFIDTFDSFKSIILNFRKFFEKLDLYSKRYFIDLLVDKIYIEKTGLNIKGNVKFSELNFSLICEVI